MSNDTRAMKKARPASIGPSLYGADLYDLVNLLRYSPVALISINSKTADGRFRSKLVSVQDLQGWTTPLDRDVWFGVNPVTNDVRPGRRGTEADVTSVSTIFADLDVKAGSLASLAECYKVVKRLSKLLDTSPMVVVESGHGLQPYWRIGDEPGDEYGDGLLLWGRQECRETYARWGGLVQQVAQEVRPGARIDNVYDLSRVLRCPGSINHKAEPVWVSVTDGDMDPRNWGLTPGKLWSVLDQRGAQPLGGEVGALTVKVPTGMSEAIDWINAQPGASDDIHEMSKHLRKVCNYDGLLSAFTGGTPDELSAHNLMRNRVHHVVRCSTEGHSGLALALNLIRHAYLAAMEARRTGEVAGEGRSESVATGEFNRAVLGAVASARSLPNSPLTRGDANGNIHLRTTRGIR